MGNVALMLKNHEKFEASTTDFKDFCAQVASGVSPGRLCADLGMNLYYLNEWIRKDPERRRMMDEALVTRSEALKWQIEDQLQAVSFLDTRKLFTEDWKLKPMSEWPPELGAAIAGIDVEDMFELVDAASGHGKEKVLVGYLKKVKAWDKMKALDLLGRQHGMFKDKSIEKMADSLEALLLKSWSK